MVYRPEGGTNGKIGIGSLLEPFFYLGFQGAQAADVRFLEQCRIVFLYFFFYLIHFILFHKHYPLLPLYRAIKSLFMPHHPPGAVSSEDVTGKVFLCFLPLKLICGRCLETDFQIEMADVTEARHR